MLNILELENLPLATLRDQAMALNIPDAKRLKKENLIVRIVQVEAEKEGIEVRGGVLEIMTEGIGFLRSNYPIGPDDVYVSQAQLRRYDLRNGDLVIGHRAPAARIRTALRPAEGGIGQRHRPRRSPPPPEL